MDYHNYLNDTYGGWIPSDYITKDLDTTPYENKKGHLYMDFGPWADKLPDQSQRDPTLRKIYLSARMMKYHPLITKKLKTTYSLIAAAALKAMTKPGRYNVKKEFNKVSGAMKAMSKKMKETKAPYGRVNRRGIFNKIDFWNRLVALPIDAKSEEIAALLQGYEPARISAQPGYAFNGPIGTTEDYDAYKELLAAKREEMRQKGLLLTDAEKKWYKQRARLLAKGKKRAREDIKAFKEAALVKAAPFELAAYKPDRTLDDIYKSAFATEIAGDKNFYNGVTADEMMREIANPNPKSWFERAYDMYARDKRGADTIPGIPHYNKFSLTDRFAETDVRNLGNQRTVPYDPSRLLTADMRKQKLTEPPHYYIDKTAKSAAASQAQRTLSSSSSSSSGSIPPTQYTPVATYQTADGAVLDQNGNLWEGAAIAGDLIPLEQTLVELRRQQSEAGDVTI